MDGLPVDWGRPPETAHDNRHHTAYWFSPVRPPRGDDTGWYQIGGQTGRAGHGVPIPLSSRIWDDERDIRNARADARKRLIGPQTINP